MCSLGTELRITGVLFGSLIQHQLVSYLALGIALRYVLDALKKPPGTNMFTFGLVALLQFKARLREWPQVRSFPEEGDPTPSSFLSLLLRFILCGTLYSFLISVIPYIVHANLP